MDTKLVELLERKINEANLPGPDYLELLQSAEELLERYNKSGIDSLFNKFSDSRKAISAPKVGEYVQFQEILKVPVNGNETPKSLDDFWGE